MPVPPPIPYNRIAGGVVTVLPFSTRLLADFLTYRTAFVI